MSPVPLPQTPRWLFALKGVLAVVAVVALVHVVEPSEVMRAVSHADPRWALLALALVPVNIGLEAYRWGRLVRRLAPEVRHRDVLRAVVGSYPLGLLTPGRLGDYVGRAVYLRAIPAGASAALTFGERMATLAACLVGGLVALVPYLHGQEAASPLWTAVMGIGWVATLALVGMILFPGLARTTIGTLLPFAPIRRAVGAFAQIPQEESVTLLLLSGVRYVVFSAQFVLLARAAVLFGALAGVLGVREGAAVYFLGNVGMGQAAALDASLALFGLNLLLPALVGVPLLLQLRLQRRAEPTPDLA